MTNATAKLTIRVNAKSPVYGYGFHATNTGWRFDIPWASLTLFRGSLGKETIRSTYSGLRWVYENNRSRRVRVAHNI